MSDPAALPLLPRSFLYVPGDRPELFAKAARGEADAVLLDLEDAVAPERKRQARTAVADWLASPLDGPQWWVRADGADLAEDLAAGTAPQLTGFVVAKSSRASLDQAASLLDDLESRRGLAPGGVGVIGLVESAAAIADLSRVAAAPRLLTLALGEADLFADLRLTRSAATTAAVDALRMQVVLTCAAAGLAAPVAPTSTAYRDLDAFAESSAVMRDLGFRSRTAVHPAQVPLINETFTPTVEELADAERALAAFAASGGSATSSGERLVDAATVRTAREVVARGRR